MTFDYSPSELANIFAKVERELASTPHDSTLAVLSRSAVDMVPGTEMAGISIGRQGRLGTRAATDDVVHVVDQLQYDLGSGPCVDAIGQDTTFNAADLRTDTRWPTFGRQAFERTGIVSMLSLRLYLEDDADLVAGLNMYSRRTAAFGEASESIGLLLATHGALAVSNAAAREKAENLLVALKNSREIGVAMGILMQRHKVTRDEAFNLLRLASQALHRKLAEIAGDVAETGELPDIPKRKPH